MVDAIKGIIADAIIVLSSNGNEEVLDREAREQNKNARNYCCICLNQIVIIKNHSISVASSD